ncbi:MAG: pepsin/retropepsin-like aspartic protease family protein [Bacteroidetes bacterium]|nr:pepsin/retropepsin-like aspartic protease family protein [Bacteroidota bacterium]
MILRTGRYLRFFLGMTATLLLFLPGTLARPAVPGMEPATGRSVTIYATTLLSPRGDVIGATIPLKRAGRLLLLEGTLDNITGNFILDTGSSCLVLNKTYFRSAMTFDDEEGGGVTGSTSSVARIHVKQLQVGELSYVKIFADVIPLGHLENRRGVKILGLFGMSLLKNVEMVLDINSNELQIFKLDKNGNRLGPPAPVVKYDIIQKIEIYHHVLFVKAVIGGKVLDFCLDTGAESNVLSIDANKNVLATVTIKRRSGLSGAGENRGEVLYGTLNEFSMGNHQMVPMETIICSLTDMSQKYGYPIDGMLGYDFFEKGRFYLNLVKNEMGICLKTEARK